MKPKTAISPVIATSLLLTITILAIIGFSNWFTTFSTSKYLNIEQKTNYINSILTIETINNNKLYLKSNTNQSLNYLTITNSQGIKMCEFEPNNLINNTGLLGYWNFEKYNDTGIFDSSENNNFGYFNGGLSEKDIIPGIKNKGKGMHFDGKDDYITIPNNEIFNNIDQMTIEIWEHYEGTNTFREQYENSLSEIGNIYNDAGNVVIQLKKSNGQGYAYIKNFTNLEGGIWIFDNTKIGNFNTNKNTHRLELIDLTTNSIITNITSNSNNYTTNLSYESGLATKNYIRFFAEKNHTYQFKIYYLANEDLNLNYIVFDTVHRSCLTKGSSMEWSIYSNLYESGNFIYFNNSGKYQLSSFQINENEDYNNNKYVHLVTVYDLINNSLKTYTNGILKNTKTNLSEIRNTNGNIYIGRKYNSDPNFFFKGNIDEIKIWNRPLNENEIKRTYQQTFKELTSKINEIDISECNLKKNQIYNIFAISDKNKIEQTIISK